MRQIVLIFILLTCLVPRIGNARVVTVESLCQYLLSPPSPSDATDPSKNLTFGQLFKYILNRGESVGIGYYDQKRILEISDRDLPPRRARNGNDRKVIIFSLGKKWQNEKRDPETTRELLEDGYWAAVKLEKDMSGMKKEPSIESCIARAWQFGVSDETLAKSQKLIDAAKEIRRAELERASFEIARDSGHFYEQAEIVPVDSVEEISAYLQSYPNATPTLDLLLILHGSDDGLLLDASGSIVPRPFFKKIGQNSNINSIAVFSCFPEQVAKFYASAFEQLGAAGIQVFFPIDKIHFGDQNTVPLNALDVFTEKHARALAIR